MLSRVDPLERKQWSGKGYDNNDEIRHLHGFRIIKELPHKTNKWTVKRDKLQKYCIKSILEDIPYQKF